ncbi:MAG: hypothetical protein WAV90_01845 [Gordonia amarae]
MDGGELLAGFAMAAAAVAAAVFVLWIVLAALMRVLAYLVLYWIIAFAVSVAIGLVAGLLIPLRVLSGKASVKPAIADPDKVVDNKVMKKPTRGMQKHFGWDNAWPVYNPYQARLDALAVTSETRHLVGAVWQRISPRRLVEPKSAASAVGSGSASKKRRNTILRVLTEIPGLLWLIVAGVPTVGFFAAVWVSIGTWLVVMLLVGGFTYLVQVVWVTGYRWIEKGGRKRRKASLMCPTCYEVTETPSYRCNGPGCTTMHRDISPGPLGMIQRRCNCGHALPTTVGRAAKTLEAFCPYCDNAMTAGAGTRRTIQIPVIGTRNAGKTRLFAAGTTAAEAHLGAHGGAIEPLTQQATEFIEVARDTMNTMQHTAQTPYSNRPQGLPFKLTVGERVIELQMMDVSGEAFKSMDNTQSLAYMDRSDVLVLVIDPLAFSAVKEGAHRMRVNRKVDITDGDQEDAYATVIDRLRSENVDLRRKSLAVVLTKYDVLSTLRAGYGLTPGDSTGIRQWLNNSDEDGFVRRIEDDFDKVEYFVVDSMGQLDAGNPCSPVRVMQWVLDVSNTKMPIVVPTPQPVER